jgi:hypothetical protein
LREGSGRNWGWELRGDRVYLTRMASFAIPAQRL